MSRILVAGDSVALTLGHEFRTEWFEAPVQVDASATYLGCGIVDGQPLNDGRPLVWDAEACRAWPQRWQDAVERVDPDVVVVLVGAWEILDLRLDGETAPVGSPRHTRHVADQLEAGLDVLMAADRPAIVLTAPCYRPHDELPGWSTSDRADDRRVAQLNALIHRVVAEHPSNARVADLRERVCPGGGYLERVDGAALRTDGVHFTTEGARYVWEWLLPEVLRQ